MLWCTCAAYALTYAVAYALTYALTYAVVHLCSTISAPISLSRRYEALLRRYKGAINALLMLGSTCTSISAPISLLRCYKRAIIKALLKAVFRRY